MKDGGSPKQKAAKEEDRPGTSKTTTTRTDSDAASSNGDGNPTMKDLLEEANKMLKNLSTSPPTSLSSSVYVQDLKQSEGRQEVLARLQSQLDSLKTFKILKVAEGGQGGLIDSGASHPLRPVRLQEEVASYKDVVVTLANGQSTMLKMSPGGAMLSENHNIEPIIPMGNLLRS